MSDCVSIVEAKYRGEYRVWLRFSTGETGEVDLRELIHSHRAAESLRDPQAFAKFHLDSWPTLTWDCGFDISPESLYERTTHTRHAAQQAA
jgi:hypothetical protein